MFEKKENKHSYSVCNSIAIKKKMNWQRKNVHLIYALRIEIQKFSH